MKYIALALSTLLATLGCAAQDKAPTGGPPAGGNAVRVAVVSNADLGFPEMPTFAAYRDGDGDWQTPTPIPGGYEILVTNDYMFVTVCVDSGLFYAGTYAATVSDGGSATVLCGTESGSLPPAPAVSQMLGTLKQAGTLWVDSLPIDLNGPANFEFNVQVLASQPNDLLAYTTTKIQVQHGVESAASMMTETVPTIDVDANGSAFQMITPQLAVAADPDETLGTDYLYNTALHSFYDSGSLDAKGSYAAVPASQIIDTSTPSR